MCSGQAILKNLIATLRGWKSTVRTLTRFVAIRSWYGLAMYSCFKSNEKGPVLTSLQHYLFPMILFRPVAYMIIWGVLPMMLAPCPRKREINKGQTSVSFPFLFLSLSFFIGHQVRRLSKYPYLVPKIKTKIKIKKQQKKLKKKTQSYFSAFLFILGSYLSFFTRR